MMAAREPNAAEPGTAAWRVIERFCGSVEIHDGPATFLQGSMCLPEAARHLFAIWWCDAEVCNGGFDQFFSNSTGVLAPEAAEGFRAVGLLECADVVKAAIERFAEPYPRDGAARKAALKAMRLPGEKRRQWDPFNELDARYYEAKNRSAFLERLDEYAVQIAS
jgi:hypothetical protein